jgi:hypothetical protein
LAPHFADLISRSMHIMWSDKDRLTRILMAIDLSPDEAQDVSDFLTENFKELADKSLRTAIKLGKLRQMDSKWESMARLSLLHHHCKGERWKTVTRSR